MRPDTRERGITLNVKTAVAERDSVEGYPCCVFCGAPAPVSRPWAFSCAHYIGRAQGGLGVEENILTLCPACHYKYDQTIARDSMREFFREYLQSKYEGWNEASLVQKKEKE